MSTTRFKFLQRKTKTFFHLLKMRVAVIGAGPCGLTSIKCCLDEGLEPVCFEKGKDLGGLWRYTTTESDHTSVYNACVMVTSKEMSCFR
jgi:dimethylaniline monooxygenase (N-oxide forming)